MIQLVIDRVIAHQTRCTVSLADVASLRTWLATLPLVRGSISNEDLMVLGYVGPLELPTKPVFEKAGLREGPSLQAAFDEVCAARESQGITTIVIMSSMSYHVASIDSREDAALVPSCIPA